jgi:hypothetical protein
MSLYLVSMGALLHHRGCYQKRIVSGGRLSTSRRWLMLLVNEENWDVPEVSDPQVICRREKDAHPVTQENGRHARNLHVDGEANVLLLRVEDQVFCADYLPPVASQRSTEGRPPPAIRRVGRNIEHVELGVWERRQVLTPHLSNRCDELGIGGVAAREVGMSPQATEESAYQCLRVYFTDASLA